ncbi:coiled-coil protein [Methanomethylovorans sp.]|uniref:coiled-coil protein n=1 Tax=Methanomethylovorans sp. TaxID=2758717 RepID=UPI00351BFB28
MTDASSISEKDLKLKVNELRTQITHDERELRSLFNELRLHRTNMGELKEKRDGLNSQVKQMVAKARELKEKRDEVNARISELKNVKNAKISASQQASDEISKLKAERDMLNQVSRGTVDIISKAYSAELDTFLNADVPLQHEIDVFGRLLQLDERLRAAMKADEVHRKIQETYDATMSQQAEPGENIGSTIKELAEISQKYHVEMIELYKKVDEMRKDADLCHAQIKEKFGVTEPLRARIDPLKLRISQLRDELNGYLEKLNDIQLVKDEKKQQEQRVVAKEKLQKTGKMSLQDLKVLMENGDLEL